jgi:ABC-2 type transport system permease protein
MFLILRYLIRALRPLIERWRSPRREGTSQSATHREPVARKPAPASAVAGPSAASRGPLMLLAHQASYDLRTSLRNPRARFFTFFFPVLLLVIFASVFGHGTTTIDGVRVKLSHYYVPGILALSLINASYANVVVSITALRESGVLKRRRATPVPPAVLIGGQAIATLAVAAITGLILLVLARVLYGVGIGAGALVAIACTSLVGTLALGCLGYAVSGLVGNPEAAQPVVQATMLPLWFISGVFIPVANLSQTVRDIAKVFPVQHLAASLQLASIHSTFGAAISATDLLVLAAWGVGAALFAAWRFSWLPTAATA